LGKRRRAYLPSEVARAFVALDELDSIYLRPHPTRIAFLVLLVTAPRNTALVSRDVGHFDPGARRIDYGQGVGKKRRGAGELDDVTSSELEIYLAGRTEGPLLLGPGGKSLKSRLLKYWKEAFGFTLVSEFWPYVGYDPLLAVEVNRKLLTARDPLGKGGDPRRLRFETRRRRNQRAGDVRAISESMQEKWRDRMAPVDVHSFRKTHRTWAEASGVPPVLIDKQLGHSENESASVLLKHVMGSRTGRLHYRDLDSSMFEARRSAIAVRGLLDEALADLSPNGSKASVDLS